MLSTGGMLKYAESHGEPARPIVATETGMLHALREAAPDVEFIPANERGLLPLHEDDHAAEAARRAARRAPRGEGAPRDRRARARIPIERMVSIG